MSALTERLVNRAQKLNLKQVDIMSATRAGKSTVHKWFNHLNDPSAKYLDDIAKVLKTNTRWLLTGIGNPDDLIVSIEGMSNIDVIPQKIRKAPVLNWVQAGMFTDMCENTYDEYDYFYDDGYGIQVYWLHVRGDSMEPQFYEGDKILVDAERQAKAGDFVIAMVDSENQATFKRYKPCGYDERIGREYCQLIALNDFYPVIDSRAVKINIIGVVVKHERKLI